jgi:hypothetical protein
LSSANLAASTAAWFSADGKAILVATAFYHTVLAVLTEAFKANIPFLRTLS